MAKELKLFGDDPAQGREHVLDEIAWIVEPVDIYDRVARVARGAGQTQQLTKLQIKALAEEGRLIARRKDEHSRCYYYLPPEEQLTRIEALAKNHKHHHDPKAWEPWAKAVQLYITGDKRYASALRDIDLKDHIELLRQMTHREAWHTFIGALPAKAILNIFDHILRESAKGLKQLPESDIKHLLTHTAPLNSKDAAEIIGRTTVFTHVWTAHIKELNTQGNSTYDKAIAALRLQYEGKNREALKLYRQALKAAKSVAFQSMTLNFFYFLALIEQDNDESRKTFSKINNDASYSRKLTYAAPLMLLIRMGLGYDTDGYIQYLTTKQGSALEFMLTLLVVKHFHLEGATQVDYSLMPDLSEPHLKLFQLECSIDFEPYRSHAEQLREETGLQPILSRVRKLEKWERVLEHLKDIDQEDEKETKPATDATRIIYHVDEYLTIEPRLQKSKNGQTWTKGRLLALKHLLSGEAEGMDDTDRELAKHIKAYHDYWGSSISYTLQGPEALAALAGCDRVYAYHSPTSPVVINSEEPHISITRTKEGLTVEHNLKDAKGDGSTRVIRETPLLYHVVHLTPQQQQLLKLFNENDTFPPEAEPALTRLLPTLSRTITIHSDLLPTQGAIQSVPPVSDITLQLMPYDEGLKAELYVKPLGDIPPYCRPAKGNRTVIGHDGQEGRQTQRNLDLEHDNMRRAEEWLMPLADSYDDDALYTTTPEQSLALLEAVREHTEIHTEWPQGERLRIAATAGPDDLHISLLGLKGWFGVEGELRCGAGQVMQMSEILDRLRTTQGRFIEMTDGVYLAISKTLRRQLQTLDAMLTSRRGKLQLPAMAAPLLTSVADSGIDLQTCPEFDTITQRIEEAETQRYTVPPQLKAELRPYQRDGYKWLARLAAWGAGACLADDMGLGKTIQTIALLLARATRGPSLVVAPASVAPNWKAELIRFAPSLTPKVVNDAADRTATIQEAAPYDVVIITYGLLLRETATLTAKHWNVITLDEAHTIKNKDTKMSHAAMTLDGDARLLLTGTPLQNHLIEIWNLFQFANPGLLGSYQQFGEKFVLPIERDHDKTRQSQLKRLLSPFILRRTKNEVLDELPEKTEITLRVELSPQERTLYETLRRQAEQGLADGDINPMQALAEIARLRMAACHPRLINPNLAIPSSKADAFMQLVTDLTTLRHRALVFSQFTSHLALIREQLDAAHIEYLYLDGATPLSERTRLVNAFQRGTQPLFLISLKAGGLGLNLTAADYVIHLDPWWNPAIEDQASDRAYRIGQQRPVTIYRLIAADTIEEKILRLHATKKSLADQLLEGSDMAHTMNKDEILALLRDNNP